MEDLIKRIDAIEAIRRERNIKALLDIPAVEPKQGEWITEYNGNGWNDYWDYTCSNCGKKYERGDAVLYKANFCPNCGARMKGVDNVHDYESAVEQMEYNILYEPTYNPEDGSM